MQAVSSRQFVRIEAKDIMLNIVLVEPEIPMNTGNIAGFTSERVIHAPAAGYIHDVRKIGDIVQKGDEIARIYPDKESYDNALSEYVSVNATITGIIRGLIREGYYFRKGFKIADIDPRESELSNCFTISDKARSIAGSVLEAVSAFEHGVKIY